MGQHQRVGGRSHAMALLLCLALSLLSMPSVSSSSSSSSGASGTCRIDASTAMLASTTLSKVPNVANLRNCLANNLGDFMGKLDPKKCSLTTLMSLFSSPKPSAGANNGGSAVMSLVKAIAGSITGSSSSSNGSTTLQQLAVNWKTDPSISDSFCDAMNSQLLPCVEVLVPAFLQIVNKDTNCCGELRQYVESISLVVPSQVTLQQQLFDLLNGLQRTLCTKANNKETCGQRLMTFLAASKDDQLSGLFLEASVPLFAIQDDAVCESLESGLLKNRLTSSSSSSFEFFPMSCCAKSFVPLLKSFDAMLQHFTGSRSEEILNLMTSLQDAPETQRFKSLYKEIQSCSFKDTCADPAVLLPGAAIDADKTANVATDTGKAKATDRQNHQPQGIACAMTKKCDQGDICSQVCEPGSVEIAPWVKRAISYQRKLAYNAPLCTTQLVGTHNSYNAMARGYGIRDQVTGSNLNSSIPNSFVRSMNQYISVTDQLNLGARFVELDAHYFAGGFRTAHCQSFSPFRHVSDSLVILLKKLVGTTGAVTWQNSLMGCLPPISGISVLNQRHHNDSIHEIATWIQDQANQQELVILYTEIGVEVASDAARMQQLVAMYQATFGDLLFTPADLVAKGGKWNDFSLQELIKANKRVILVADPKENDAMFYMRTLCDGWVDIPQKSLNTSHTGPGTLWGQKINNGVLVRSFQSLLRFGMFDEADLSGFKNNNVTVSPSTPFKVDAETLPVFTKAGVNILAPDELDGVKVEAMVWSWAPKEPINGASQVFVAAKDGRWYGSKDKKTPQKACVKSMDRSQWEIVASDAKCSEGFVEGAPVSAVENELLVQALKSKAVDAVVINVDLSSLPPISDQDEKAFEDKLTQTESKKNGDDNGTSGAGMELRMPTCTTVALVLGLWWALQ